MTYDDVHRHLCMGTNSLERGTTVRSVNFILCDILRYRKLVLFTNRKSPTGLRLVPKSVTLNNLERYNDCPRTISLR